MDLEQGEGRSGIDDKGGEGGDRMQMMLLTELRELRKDIKEQRESGTAEKGEGAYHKEQKGEKGYFEVWWKEMMKPERSGRWNGIAQLWSGWRGCSRLTITFYYKMRTIYAQGLKVHALSFAAKAKSLGLKSCGDSRAGRRGWRKGTSVEIGIGTRGRPVLASTVRELDVVGDWFVGW
ncbi:hypothetical protein BT69DRAFT_1299533 [Atractiella rhizophila]|nr:hypothetical protein BT69DRAFT_1299533 [Atractiella rhizophila]